MSVVQPPPLQGISPAALLGENVLGIDHVAVAVADLAGAVEWAVGKLGCVLLEERETQGKFSGMKSAVLKLGGFVVVLVQGTSSESQVTQFVAHHGPGVQHIALRVQDVAQAATTLESRGMTFSTPKLDGENLSQIFSLRDPVTGLMIELIERRNGYTGFSDENVSRLFRSLEQRQIF
ncbi:VOC family protein [Variovorax boronicumulans]|uniref:VOC family protein n=1 Tax=Variovorax boronicumulans TaxID=436515 RepID=UPI00339749E8